MNRGDRVDVIVFGQWVRGTVIDPATKLGNVKVQLDEPVDVPGSRRPVDVIVRAVAHVRASCSPG